eukprot:g31086.t1
MTFDEMLGVFRKGFPGLSISPQKLPEQDQYTGPVGHFPITSCELRGFWRALDAHRSGRVEVYDFMIFMRKYGAQYSMHKTPRGRRSTKVNFQASVRGPPQPAAKRMAALGFSTPAAFAATIGCAAGQATQSWGTRGRFPQSRFQRSRCQALRVIFGGCPCHNYQLSELSDGSSSGFPVFLRCGTFILGCALLHRLHYDPASFFAPSM